MTTEINDQIFFVGAIITSVLGGIIILFTDFASWYNHNWYSGIESWGEIYAGFDIPLALVLLAIVAAFLFFSAAIAFMGLNPQKEIENNLIIFAFLSSLAATATLLAGGLLFAIVMLIDEPTTWGFEPGFYIGLPLAVLTAFFFYLIIKLNFEKNKKLLTIIKESLNFFP